MAGRQHRGRGDRGGGVRLCLEGGCVAGKSDVSPRHPRQRTGHGMMAQPAWTAEVKVNGSRQRVTTTAQTYRERCLSLDPRGSDWASGITPAGGLSNEGLQGLRHS